MEKFDWKKSGWLWGAVLFIVGLLMLINPSGCAKAVVVLFGIAAIALSIYNIIFTSKNFTDENYKRMILIKSVVGIVFGILAVIFALPFATAAWTVMVYIFAIYLIAASVFGFYTVSLLKDIDVDRKRYIFENLGLLVAAILIFLITPQTLGEIIIRIIGAAALVVGIILLVIEIISVVKNKKNTVEVAEADVTVVDEPEQKSAEAEEKSEEKSE